MRQPPDFHAFALSFLRCLRLPALLLALCGACQLMAAPLTLKDDFRSPRNKERPFRKSTRLIVLHTTEAHAKSALNKLCERGEAHYCVTENGDAYRIVDRDREAFHAGRSMWNGKEDCDEFSVGIEVVGYHDKAMPLKQLEGLKELVSRLKKIYGITDGQVVCHSHVAYGAPNTWHRQKHRGRKRCGMLFAMPSVRAKLGLTARPAYDPDTRAKRLVQADPELERVLYGNVDTMALVYGRARPQLSARPVAKPVASSSKPPAKAKPAPKAVQKPAPRPVRKPELKVVQKPAPKPVQKPVPKVVQKPAPKPVPKVIPKPVPPPEPPPETKVAEVTETNRDWLTVLGMKGGYFKKRAKLVVPKEEPSTTEPEPPMDGGETGSEPEEPAPDRDGAENASPVLPLPKDLHVAKMGDDVKDLEALAKLPGYARGGPVNGEQTPFKIAGAAWRSPSTYYYFPDGKIVAGDKIDEKSVVSGTFIFFKK